jgi:putative FmdB family regulatory protein
MPIYEYACRECNHHLEALQKISDAPLTECPACGASALKKLVSAASFRLKGGGWYETDFKNGGQRGVASSDRSEPEGKSEQGASPKGEGGKAASPDGASKSDDSKRASGTGEAATPSSGS